MVFYLGIEIILQDNLIKGVSIQPVKQHMLHNDFKDRYLNKYRKICGKGTEKLVNRWSW